MLETMADFRWFHPVRRVRKTNSSTDHHKALLRQLEKMFFILSARSLLIRLDEEVSKSIYPTLRVEVCLRLSEAYNRIFYYRSILVIQNKRRVLITWMLILLT
jgi:hypothetical protein